jgi:hypothetical protein
MDEDIVDVPPESRILVLAGETFTFEVPGEIRVIEVPEPCS